MKNWLRILSLALVLLMVCSAMPVFAAESEPEEDTPEDVVLLLDCSSSLTKNDPKNLCLEACKNFIDQMPTQNARITVIGFGLDRGEWKTFSEVFQVHYNNDAKAISSIVPLSGLGDTEQKTEYKKTLAKIIAETRNAPSMGTPLGHALAAAVSLLEENGTEKGKGCIIMVSDGVHTPRTLSQDEKFIDIASKRAGEFSWPIYCVGLSYNIGNPDEAKAAKSLMGTICANSGQNRLGAISCATPTDVFQSFKSIFADFYGIEVEPAQPMNLPGETSFEIPPLTSEANVDIFGYGIGKVILTYQDQGTEWVITKSEETHNRIVVVEKDSYVSIKLICPADGKWNVRVEPAAGVQSADASVLVSNSSLREMGLTMTAVPSTNSEVLNKTDEVKINAVFAYRGTSAEPTDFYIENPATLKLYLSDGSVKSVPMGATRDGYNYTLKMSEIPVGAVEVQVELSHTMFRNGKKVSNSAIFKTQNLPLELKKTEPTTLNAFVNGGFDKINLDDIFSNPDGDPVTYTFSCEDKDKSFAHTIENGYLKIEAGVVPGTYPVQIAAADPDMKEPLVYRFNLVVENRTPAFEGTISLPQLWLEDFPAWLQEVGEVSAEVDLGSFFSDPDGMPLTYTVTAAPMAGEDGDVIVANVELVGGKFVVTPNAAGKTTITITCTDGLETVETTTEVEVVSAKSVYWKQNGWLWVVTIAAIIFLIFVIVMLFVTTKVRGRWGIEVTKTNKGSVSCNPVNLTTCGKKCKGRSFLLKDMMVGATKFLRNGNPEAAESISDYFTRDNGGDKLKLHGVALGNGFKISGMPKNTEYCSVRVDGRAPTKKPIRSGRVEIRLRRPNATSNDEIIITLTSAAKGKR